MNNVLEFALGLQASEFLSKLDTAGRELRSFAGVADAMVAAFNKQEGGRFAEARSDWEGIKFREGKNRFEMTQHTTEIFASEPGRLAGAGQTAFADDLRSFISQTIAGIAGEWRAVDAQGAPRVWLMESMKTGWPAMAIPNPGEHDGKAALTGANASEVQYNEKSHFRPEFTALEKMGFIMSGEKVQNPYHQRSLDLLQQIAENTKRPAPVLPALMPDNKHLHDIIDPSPFISNIV